MNISSILLIIIVIALYLLPSIIAAYQKKKNGAAIFILNLLLGWTLIGWVVAIVWAFTYEESVKPKTK